MSDIARNFARALRGVGATLLNASLRGSNRVTRNLSYGPLPRHKLDLYVPKTGAGLPVVLFLYGGGWTSGDRLTYPFVAEALTSAGIIAAVADYRLYPEVKYPAFLEDSAAAFRFLRREVQGYGGDPARIFVAGHSAGAYNAAMLAVDRRYLDDEERAALAGVIGIAGLYDFLPLKSADLIAIFGGDNVKETQPIEYVDRKVAPMLLAQGLKDDVLDPGNTSRMASKLRAHDSEVELREYPNAGHTDILVSLARGFRGRTPLREDIIRFVRAH